MERKREARKSKEINHNRKVKRESPMKKCREKIKSKIKKECGWRFVERSRVRNWR